MAKNKKPSALKPFSFPPKTFDTAVMTEYEPPTQILSYLFLGPGTCSQDKKWLEDNNIGGIINVTRTIPCTFPEDYEYLQIKIADIWNQDLLGHLDLSYEFIERIKISGKSVLIHCAAGISRSSAVTVAYLMNINMDLIEESSRNKETVPKDAPLNILDRALLFVEGKRHIDINLDFMGQLLMYHKILTS